MPKKVKKSKKKNSSKLLVITGTIFILLFIADEYYKQSVPLRSFIDSKIGSKDDLRDRNCTDFKNQKEAQNFFELNGGPDKDPHGLDKDGNGLACEYLP